MKKIKNSVCALLSATALLFSSCLGDSDYTPTIGCTGTPYGIGSEILLDNGITVSVSNVEPTALMNEDRVFVYGQLAGESAELEEIKPGDKITITGSCYPMEEIEPISEAATEEEAFASVKLTEVGSFNWFAMGGSIFNALNGYMNFALYGDCYTKKAGSGSSSSDNYTLVTPNYYMYISKVDKEAKIVDLVFGYDNRKDECVDENGKLKDGYSFNENVLLPFLFFDVRSLYYEFEDLADEDMIVFNVYTATKDKDGKLEKDKVDLSYTSIPKSALKRTYGKDID